MALLNVYDVAGSYNVDLEKVLAEVGTDTLVLGRSKDADITIADEEISRRHLEFRLVKGQWAVEDLGSTNGTRLNGDELLKRAVLHSGDELRVGATTIDYRDYSNAGSSTGKKAPAPAVTPGERAVLKELCRPYFSNSRTKSAAERADIARALFVGEAAVQAHLGNLYMKFDIVAARGKKRDLLAEKVMDAGVITRRDYVSEDDDPSSG